jgi:RNA polymerase sigma-70 factor (ECF subfamily)
MPEKQRIAFTLKVLLDLTVAEIASIMDISEGAVRVNIYRARQHMKNNMEGRCSLIDSRNPCNCNLWTKFIRDGGMLKPAATIPEPADIKNGTAVFNKELLLLARIKSLYDTVPAKSGENRYAGILKEIIARKKLRVLS